VTPFARTPVAHDYEKNGRALSIGARVVRLSVEAQTTGLRSKTPMQYMLLIYANEAEFNRRAAESNGKITQEYMKFTEDIKKSGHLKLGDRLESVTTATTVRERDGKLLTTDGPFAETREQLGGYYIIEAKDLDEAVGIAAKLPGTRFGSVEVRPIVRMG
jgi:hypothetical protein